MRILFLLLVTIIFVRPLQAQIGQISATPEINPGFAGSTGNTRLFYSIHDLGTKYKGQKAVPFDLYNVASVDLFVKKISSGVGLLLRQDNLGLGNPYYEKSHGDEMKFTVAPKISIKGKVTVSPAISLSVYTNTHKIYFNTGILVNSKKGFIGMNYMGTGKTKYAWESTLHMGYIFQKTEDAKFTFTPSILWELNSYLAGFTKKDGPLINLLLPDDANLNFSYKRIVWGVGAGFTYAFYFLPPNYNDSYRNYLSKTYHALAGYQSKNKKLRILLEGSIKKYPFNNSSERIIGISCRYLFLNNRKNSTVF